MAILNSSQLSTKTLLASVLARLKKSSKTSVSKTKNSAKTTKYKNCWKGYKKHPTIKEGPGSCVPDN
jgi:hypothetical protein